MTALRQGHWCSGALLAWACAGLALLLASGCCRPVYRCTCGGDQRQYPSDHLYTLDELIELSVCRNASLDAARYTAAAFDALVDQVKALWLPAVRYDFAATTYNHHFNYHLKALRIVGVDVPLTGNYNLANTLNLAEVVTTGGKRTSALKQAKLLAELARIDVLRQQDCVACQVATLYQIVCLTSQTDAILDDSLRRIGVLRQVAQGLNERGGFSASDLDTLEADLLIQALQELQVAAKATRQQAYDALKQAVGLDPAEPMVLKQTELPPIVSNEDRLRVAAAIEQGFWDRPEIKEINLFARIAAEQVRFAKACYAPNVAVIGSATVITGDQHPVLNAVDGLIAGLIIDVPIYDPARRARLRAALNLERAGQALQREVEQLITLEIEATGIGAHEALTNLALAEQARVTADEHYDAAKQAYSRDLIAASAVVVALALDTAARVNELASVFAYHNARTQLKRVTGDRETPYGS
jgi:outer membrane protein TolC